MKKVKGNITTPAGFEACGVKCQIKASGNHDLAVIYAKQPAVSAAVFTTSKVAAPPVVLSKKYLRSGRLRAVVVNSGNANACTGAKGMQNAIAMTELTAAALSQKYGIKILPSSVLVASTGIIGHQLPMDKVKHGISLAVSGLGADTSESAAKAIMTTDLTRKTITVNFDLSGTKVSMSGIAKGSGMIHPNMATMLAFITTDASILPPMLKKAMRAASNESFNNITVDGVTSTNDMALVMASAAAGNQVINHPGKAFDEFQDALTFVSKELAKMIVIDGEGATKLISVQVKNARNKNEAKAAAMEVAGSNLVKCAFFGEDPNWGRIMASLGQSGANFTQDKVSVKFGNFLLVKKGTPVKYEEGKVRKYLTRRDINVLIDLQEGDASSEVLTCDLSYDYVKINAEYTT